MQRLALALMLLCLAANSRPPTREEVEEEAHKFITQCRAGHLLAVEVETPENVRIRLLKPPTSRTEADLKALRCLGRRGSAIVDFRPLADQLLGITPAP
jgi:hypothetical protein